ncbi:acyltransferase family protein [Leptospira neocaledonica]|uniref:Acyltransferase 3 domain-containing protein n=1 Tax=Leptospira neocaledonica TaxID=2023192 RepID=A0A2M9ZXK0_9LEPT|nr:acyltransferase [Leptospira neocaledonica]PJZ76782.1 hypothetical protein CH365_12235 [Leptospira neocaledonica]
MKKLIAAVFLQKKDEIPELNGIRAMAILMVMIGHLMGGLHALQLPMDTNPYIDYFLGNLDSGVDLFFILSGFLISSGLMIAHNSQSKNILTNFYIKRTLRIFPSYYFFLLFSGWIILGTYYKLSNQPSPNPESLTIYSTLKDRLIFDVFYLSNIFKGALPHTWSLSTEEHFYLVFPFLALFLIFKLNPKNRLSTYILLFVTIALIRNVLIFLSVKFDSLSGLNTLTETLRFDTILVGVIIADLYIYHKDQTENFIRKYFPLLLIISIVILLIGHLGSKKDLIGYEMQYRHILFSLGFGLVIAILLFGNKTILNVFFSLKIWIPIARLSYTIYLWHFITSGIVKVFAPLIKGKVVTYGLVAALFSGWLIFSIIVTLIIFGLIELPFHKLRDKILSKESA